MQNISIPFAIIIAGALIAGAIFLSNGGGNAGGNVTTRSAPVEIRAVSAEEHIRGNADAKVVLVEFSDTECPFCKQFDTTMHQVIEEYGEDVAWAYRHFPLEVLHPKAPKEAEALECAWEQGGNDMFWKYSDLLYSSTNSNNSFDIGVYNTPKEVPIDPYTGDPYYMQKTPRSSTDAGQLSDLAVELGLNKAAFEKCLKDGTFTEKVAADTEEAGNSGGNGTPYSVLVSKEKIGKDTKDLLNSLISSVGPDTFVLSDDGYRISMSGALPFEMLQQVIDSLLN